MSDSPVEQLIEALEKLDLEALMALVAPNVQLLTVDGRRGQGEDEVRALFADFVATLRSTRHTVLDQWHMDDVWIAELEGTYELQDWLQLGPLPRAFFLREGPEGITQLHAYGAHERPLTEHRTGEEGMWIGERWIPPL